MTTTDPGRVTHAAPLWPVEALLGEGPLWDARSDRLWFVDIKRGRVHACSADGSARKTVEAGTNPCFILPSDDGGFLVGDGHALHRFDGTRMTSIHARLQMPAGNRLNDATVDRAGRLWFGSMDDDERRPTGQLYRHEAGEIQPAGGACIVSNGPAVSADGRVLYHVDTVGGMIWRFCVSADGTLNDPVPFVRIDPADGSPDGVTIDAEGHLWVALWGGWQARRYAADGRLVQSVRFPCALVTKIALGGADLRTAYATTARIGLRAQALEEQPLAGAVFTFRVDVPGVPMQPLRLGPPPSAG